MLLQIAKAWRPYFKQTFSQKQDIHYQHSATNRVQRWWLKKNSLFLLSEKRWIRVSRQLHAPTSLHFGSEPAVSKQWNCIGGCVFTRAELDVMMMVMINVSVLSIRRAVVVLPETIKVSALGCLRYWYEIAWIAGICFGVGYIKSNARMESQLKLRKVKTVPSCLYGWGGWVLMNRGWGTARTRGSELKRIGNCTDCVVVRIGAVRGNFGASEVNEEIQVCNLIRVENKN